VDVDKLLKRKTAPTNRAAELEQFVLEQEE